MHGDDKLEGTFLWHGPRVWAASAAVGALAGWGLTRLAPPALDAAGKAIIPMWLVVPFALLLLCIAICPLISPRAWHRHFPDVAFVLGSLIGSYYLFGFTMPGHGALTYGQYKVVHSLVEYYAFIALVGGLYIVCGTILVDLRGRAGPASNTVFLLLGAILANIIGTTGASMLLIRPFMRANEGRLRPLHIVFFIFIVSNCGGSLTPIGDPPLYLGYLKGIPFEWTLFHLWKSWLATVGALLVVFFVYDSVIERRAGASTAPASLIPKFSIRAKPLSFILLAGMIAAVFIDPLLSAKFGISDIPIGATVQIIIAVIAFVTADKEILSRNDFSFFPVKEVGLLFAGIFLTMIPALGYLASHGSELGLTSPTAYYYGTGVLSAVLDNAPTYLNFLQIALTPQDVDRTTLAAFISTMDGQLRLIAISTGAVLFGAMTYIGNGPNFMVRTIAESAQVKMPSFFGYALWAIAILLPILVLHWFVLIR